MVPVGGFSVLTSWGSKSSDIPGIDSIENPLPPCPNSPNCIRLTKRISAPIDSAFTDVQKAIRQMNPTKMDTSENCYKITAVFKVFFYMDDMTVQLTEEKPESSFLHIRSSSRVGFSDLGVNRRRVKRFLKTIKSLSKS